MADIDNLPTKLLTVCFVAGAYAWALLLWLARMIWLGVLVVWVGASRAFRLLTSDSNGALLFWTVLSFAVLGWLVGGR